MIRTALIATLIVTTSLLAGCSGSDRRAKIAGEEMFLAWTPVDPERPVFSPEVAVRRCEGLAGKMEVAVYRTALCSMKVNSRSSRHEVREYCGDAVVAMQLAMSPWRDITSAPQTSEVRACRQEIGAWAAELERAASYQRQLMLFAQGSGAAPPYFLRDRALVDTTTP